ncbi:MAG: 3-keto-5-aminohexanoate cleavage protein [Armatimonadota bacterium]|nr:3-keto-5-aminohexanoate cleavage protein [Armatimonadota bacterium]MDR7469498.1 3-keto-5-aminohexanoate cleavage protein [Armatimonadota bacterium]MDR7475449.1 3-keto-5-aminohexanoate cleavage protein [Armatimonadota bacterium]
MDDVIITCALTGAQQGKEANPNLPTQPEEIVQQGVDAWNAGAAILHIHARDPHDRPTADVAIFRRIVEGIRARGCDAVLNLSTGGAVAGLPLQERIRIVPALKPEVASFSVGGGSLLGRYDRNEKRWVRDEFVPLVRSYSEMEQIARVFLANGVKPELEVYSTAFLNNVWTLKNLELLQEPLLVNLVTGIPGECTPWSPKNIIYLVESLPPNSLWLVTAIGGKAHFLSAAFSMAAGGHVRVGLEDNVYLEKGVLARSNAELVEKAVRIAREVGREVATPYKARQMLGLRP